MRDELQCNRGQNGAGETLYLSGDLDVASAPVLARAIAAERDGQGGHIRLDINDLAFVDLTGGRALLHIHNAIEAGGGRAVFERPRHAVLRVLRLLGLDQVLDIRP